MEKLKREFKDILTTAINEHIKKYEFLSDHDNDTDGGLVGLISTTKNVFSEINEENGEYIEDNDFYDFAKDYLENNYKCLSETTESGGNWHCEQFYVAKSRRFKSFKAFEKYLIKKGLIINIKGEMKEHKEKTRKEKMKKNFELCENYLRTNCESNLSD